MATKTEVRVVKLAAVAQGVALVTFPAASTILTDPSEYDLSSVVVAGRRRPDTPAVATGAA